MYSNKACEGVLGLRVCGRDNERMEVPFLLFANETFILSDANQGQMYYLSWTVMWFEGISSLKINLENSELIPIGAVANVEELAFVLGYMVGPWGKLPTTYLDLSLGPPHKLILMWRIIK